MNEFSRGSVKFETTETVKIINNEFLHKSKIIQFYYSKQLSLSFENNVFLVSKLHIDYPLIKKSSRLRKHPLLAQLHPSFMSAFMASS